MNRVRAVCGVLLVLGVAPAFGQGPFVAGLRQLGFGTVLPGMPSSVQRTDAVNSGVFLIWNPARQNMQFTFTLPAVLAGPAGATMPIVFSGTSAGYSATGSIASQVGFDPRQPFAAPSGPFPISVVYLGGTVTPNPSQRAGSYTATVTLSVVFL